MELVWQELLAGGHYNWLLCLTKYHENRSRNSQPHEFHLNYPNLNFKTLLYLYDGLNRRELTNQSYEQWNWLLHTLPRHLVLATLGAPWTNQR